MDDLNQHIVIATEWGTEYEVNCPICGAEPYQSCSKPDPNQLGLGIDLGNRVHQARQDKLLIMDREE